MAARYALEVVSEELRVLRERAGRPSLRQIVAKVEHLFSSNYFARPFWFEPAKKPPAALTQTLRKTAMRQLGWPEDPRPVICIFFHCFSDLPRDDAVYWPTHGPAIPAPRCTGKISAAVQNVWRSTATIAWPITWRRSLRR